MKLITTVFILTITATLFAQSDANEVLEAERAFARMARDKSTKAAFLNFLGSDALVAAGGELVNGLSRWKEIPEDTALLAWWPILGDISRSGDLGYTTGPFEFSPGRKGQKPVGFGYYATIWKKTDGIWKVFIDLGISLRESDHQGKDAVMAKSISTPGEPSNEITVVASREAELNKSLNASRRSFDANYLADEFRVHRTTRVPMTTLASLEAFDESARKHSFEMVGSGIATSGDMAYTYGNTRIEIVRGGESKTIAANYMRVWKKIGSEWRIVLDVVSLG